jgi:hypothetical protein
MTLSFANKKALRFVITLATGKFGSADNNQITLQGFRAAAEIENAGGMQMSTLKARIYGVTQADMNAATTLIWKPGSTMRNSVAVYAIDGATETMVFAGNIINAWGDYQNMPDVSLYIQAAASYDALITAAPARSFKGSIPVATAMEGLAKDMGLAFENNGVTGNITDMYLCYTLLQQVRDLAHMAGIDYYIANGTLAIAPKGQARMMSGIPIISPETGLIGYPTFNGYGVNFEALFNPDVLFGGAIKLVTDLTQAAGQWAVYSLNYRLESEKPGGAWFMRIGASGYDFSPN